MSDSPSKDQKSIASSADQSISPTASSHSRPESDLEDQPRRKRPRPDTPLFPNEDGLPLEQELALLKQHLDKEKKKREEVEAKLADTKRQLRERDAMIVRKLTCPVCGRIALCPMVNSKCGHIICQSCLMVQEQAVASRLTRKDRLLGRVCPLCRAEHMGMGFPVRPLHDLAVSFSQLLGQLPSSSTVDYPTPTEQQLHLDSLQTSMYGSRRIAEHTIRFLHRTVPRDYFDQGVFFLFHRSFTRGYVERFLQRCDELDYKLAMNFSCRMIALQRRVPLATSSTSSTASTGSTVAKASTRLSTLLFKISPDGRVTAHRSVRDIRVDLPVPKHNNNHLMDDNQPAFPMPAETDFEMEALSMEPSLALLRTSDPPIIPSAPASTPASVPV
jgi:hypothetical protein